MNGSSTIVSTYDNSSVSSDFFGNLQKSWNISQPILILIGVCIVAVIIILTIIVIYCLRRCLKSEDEGRKKKRNENHDEGFFFDNSEKNESKYGFLDFIVTYNRQKKNLIIRDIQALNLNSPSPEPPDVFVKLYLKNEEGKKIHIKKTKIKVDNYAPFYNETFVFHIENIIDAIIYFQVIDDNPDGNDIFLGEGSLDMKRLSMDSYIGLECNTYVILDRPSDRSGSGDMCVILSSRLDKQRIVILEAKGIVYKYAKEKYPGVFKYPSVYVTVSVKINNTRKKHFVTRKMHNTNNPYFMETFDVKIKRIDLSQTCIKISVFESIPSRTSRRIGQIFIGNPKVNAKINAIGKLHWDSICQDPIAPKAMWHSLMI